MVMANGSDSNREVGDLLRIARVEAGDRRREVLALLLTGRAHAPAQAIDGFLGFAAGKQLCLEQLWALYREQRAIGAVLIVPGAGRSAMVFVSPILERSLVGPMGQLAAAACGGQDPGQIRIIQALLDPHQQLEAQALVAGGFTDMACLRYLQHAIPRTGSAVRFDDAIELLTWRHEHRSLFARAIEVSYEGTQDCPGLLGMRHIDDIIASHMAAGQFLPELWFVLIHDDQPVAVMLMNLVPQRHAIELVYLGVSPAWRRRGIARQLVGFGLTQCQRYNVSAMILAVDESNTPATHLYATMGFLANARKSAMIFALP